MIRKKKITEIIILVVFVAVLGSFCNQRMRIPDIEENNMPASDFNVLSTMKTSTIEYNGYIYPLSCVEKKQKVYLDVREIETFETGTLYTLELQQIEATEEWGDISMGRRYLGYFYVTEDTIYRRQ